jgi:hypothetical protein
MTLAKAEFPWSAVDEALNFPLYARAGVLRDTALVHYRDPVGTHTPG